MLIRYKCEHDKNVKQTKVKVNIQGYDGEYRVQQTSCEVMGKFWYHMLYCRVYYVKFCSGNDRTLQNGGR